MSKRTHESATGTMLFSISTVANRLEVSRDTVRRLIAHGHLTAIRVGSTLRVDAAELEAFVERQRQQNRQRRES